MSVPARVALLAGGLAAFVAAGRLGHEPLALHMAQHGLIAAVAAPLVALAAPAGLALRALDRARRRTLLAALRSAPVAALTHPLVTWPLFVAIQWAIHLDPLLALSTRNDAVHAAEHAALLAAGVLFWLPVVGRNPLARPLRRGARAAYLVAAVPALDVIGLYFMATGRPEAGAAMLAASAPVVVAAAAVTWQWLAREEARRTRWEAYVDAHG